MTAVAPVFALRFRRLFAAAFAAASLSFGAAADAAQIIVTTVRDGLDKTDGCSLREAIINAETDSRAGSHECAAGSGADEIILLPDTMGLSSSLHDENDPAVGDLDIKTDITILGGGQQFSVINAGLSGRIFDVRPGGRLTLRGVMLRKGYASDQLNGQPYGGAIRVAGPDGVLLGGTLLLQDVGVNESRSSSVPGTENGGAAIYAGPNTQVEYVRGQLMYNESRNSVGFGEGAGILCAGCTLKLDAVTFAKNKASRGGAIYLGPGSDAELQYVTVGFNEAAEGAGIFNDAGELSYFASVSAENMGGIAGDDLTCTFDSTFSGKYSFAEYPLGCSPMTGVRARSDLPAGTEAKVFFELPYQRLINQPSLVLQASRGEILDIVPAAECAGHYDQLGTPGVHTPLPSSPAPASSDPGCSSGAYEYPVAAVGVMAVEARAPNQLQVQLSVGVLATLGADARMHFRVRGSGGIGESCSLSVAPVDIPRTTSGGTVTIQAGLLFPTASLDRRRRVCEFEGVLESPEPIYNGATTGVLRILYDDGISKTGDLISTPAAGSYLDFGTGAPGANIDAKIQFKASADPLRIESAVITGVDAGAFSLITPISALEPLETNLLPGAPVPLDIRCSSSTLGAYDQAVLAVSGVRTVSNTSETLVYGLRCRVAHQVAFVASPDFGQIYEHDVRPLTVTARLDSPNATAEPINIEFYESGGSATPDRALPPGVVGDYVPFVPDPAFPLVLSILPGEQEVSFDIAVIDDLVFSEPAETILIRPVLPSRPDVVLMDEGARIQLRILDNDEPEVGVGVMISGMPTNVSPGADLTVHVLAENSSNMATFGSASVSLEVDRPVQVLSYLVVEAAVTCEAHRQFLLDLEAGDPVAQQAALDAEPCANGTMLYSRGVDQDNDGVIDFIPRSALALVTRAKCGVRDEMRIGSCDLRTPMTAGAKVKVQAILRMATMSSTPQLDYEASMRARMSGAGVQSGGVQAEDEAFFVIDGRRGGVQGGGALGWMFLFVMVLLALRGRQKGPLVG